MTEIIRYLGHPTTISLFYTSVFILLVFIGINALLRRYKPEWLFSQGELITIYVMVNLGAAMVGHDQLQILVSLMPYATYFSNSTNNWDKLFANKLPDWLIVKDPVASKNFYMGNSSLYDPANFGPWIVPVLCWAAFTIVLVTMFLCMNVLLRKQWTEREKLSYPLVQLPLDMAAEGSPLFKDKLLWYGLLIAVAIDLINGLHVLYPAIPQLPIKTAGQSFVLMQRPWNNIGVVPMQFYPFGIGLGMLLPVDLLFSCWFFYWVWKAQYVLMTVIGVETIEGMPFTSEQSFGAYMGICVFAILISRRHFIDVFKHFLGMKTDIDDKGEPISYKAAMWALILGFLFLTWFSLRAGLSFWLLVPFWLIFFAMSIAITRMRAELGPPAHDLQRAGPDGIIPILAGSRDMSTQNLNAFSMFYWFNRAYRAHPMPFQLEGFKMAEKSNTNYTGLFWAMMLATVVGTFVAFWVILHLLYHYGAASSTLGPPNVPLIFGREPWNRMESWVNNPQPTDVNRMGAIIVGLSVTLLLNSLRMKLGWFPFHPVGYAVSSSWSMSLLWLPLFIAWLIKLLILRYGGLKLYSKALPFFLGVILGECVMGSLWTIVGCAFGIPYYAFWP